MLRALGEKSQNGNGWTFQSERLSEALLGPSGWRVPFGFCRVLGAGAELSNQANQAEMDCKFIQSLRAFRRAWSGLEARGRILGSLGRVPERVPGGVTKPLGASVLVFDRFWTSCSQTQLVDRLLKC